MNNILWRLIVRELIAQYDYSDLAAQHQANLYIDGVRNVDIADATLMIVADIKLRLEQSERVHQ